PELDVLAPRLAGPEEQCGADRPQEKWKVGHLSVGVVPPDREQGNGAGARTVARPEHAVVVRPVRKEHPVSHSGQLGETYERTDHVVVPRARAIALPQLEQVEPERIGPGAGKKEERPVRIRDRREGAHVCDADRPNRRAVALPEPVATRIGG